MVIAGLEQRGYTVFHVVDSRLMRAGLPDVIAVKPGAPLLLLELKRQKGGRVRPEQADTMAALQASTEIIARIVRPQDWLALSEEV